MLVELNFNSLLPLTFYALSCFSLYYLNEQYQDYSQVLLMIIDSFSFLFVVILEDFLLVRRFSSKIGLNRSNKYLRNRNKKIKRLKQKINFDKTYSIMVILLLGSLTSLISSLSYVILYLLISGFASIYCIFNIMFSWVFLRMWFKWKIHRHHVLGIGLLFIGLLISLINYNNSSIVFEHMFFESYLYIIGAFIGIGILIPGREIIEKYTLDILFYTQSRLMFYEGIVSLIINCICLGVLQLFECNRKGDLFSPYYFCRQGQLKTVELKVFLMFGYGSLLTLYSWLYVLATIISNVLRLSINKQFGPTQRYTMDLIGLSMYVVLSEIIFITSKYETPFDWVNLLVIVILIIGCLIYNENIEIHVLGLATNVKAQIQKRAEEDSPIELNLLLLIED